MVTTNRSIIDLKSTYVYHTGSSGMVPVLYGARSSYLINELLKVLNSCSDADILNLNVTAEEFDMRSPVESGMYSVS